MLGPLAELRRRLQIGMTEAEMLRQQLKAQDKIDRSRSPAPLDITNLNREHPSLGGDQVRELRKAKEEQAKKKGGQNTVTNPIFGPDVEDDDDDDDNESADDVEGQKS